MAYRKKVKYRKDISPSAMFFYIKSLKARKKIIPDDEIYELRAGEYDFGFPEWWKEGFIYSFANFRIANLDEIVAVKKSSFRRLAKYVNIDLIKLVNIYFITSTLAVYLPDNEGKNIYEVTDDEIGVKFKNVNWWVESEGTKFLILEKRRFSDLNYKFKKE